MTASYLDLAGLGKIATDIDVDNNHRQVIFLSPETLASLLAQGETLVSLLDSTLKDSAITVTSTVMALPTGAATETTLSTLSGKFPTSLVSGRLDVNIGACPVTLTVTGPLTDTQLRATPVVVSQEKTSSTAVLTSVTASASTQQLVAANTARKKLIIFNDSSAILYVAFAATASLTAFTYKIAAGSSIELNLPIYPGVISGIWDSATGAARITEIS